MDQLVENPVTVLVIDDSLIDLRIIETDLKRMCLLRPRIVLCPKMENALTAVKYVTPLVVLLDDNLGPIGTAEVNVKRLRESGCISAIVVMSGSFTLRRYDALKALGCFEVVEKNEFGPDSLELLLVTVAQSQRAKIQAI